MSYVHQFLLLSCIGLSAARFLAPLGPETTVFRRNVNFAELGTNLDRDCFFSPLNCNAFLKKIKDDTAMAKFHQKMRTLMMKKHSERP
uniref:Uncharacterized protein n=1 Tax=Plectus sambesii TaxID=2011161 RepID=A0A914X1Y4_9BILA